MISLNQTAPAIKKLGIISAIVSIILVLIFLIFLRYSEREQDLTPALPPPTITQDPSQNQPESFVFPNLESLAFPKSLPTFQADLINFNDTSLQAVAQAFGIASEPFLIEEQTLNGRQLNWQENGKILSINNASLRYSDSGPFTNQDQNLTLQELEDRAKEFIQEIPILDKSLTLQETGTAFIILKDEDFLSENSLEKAQVVEFKFEKRLDNYPLYNGGPLSSYLEIRLDKKGNVTNLKSRIFEGFTQENEFNLKELDSIIEEVRNGQGKIVHTAIPDPQGHSFELFRVRPFDIERLEVQNITLGYFLGLDYEESIQPVFILEGEFQHSTQEVGRSYIIVPAIR